MSIVISKFRRTLPTSVDLTLFIYIMTLTIRLVLHKPLMFTLMAGNKPMHLVTILIKFVYSKAGYTRIREAPEPPILGSL